MKAVVDGMALPYQVSAQLHQRLADATVGRDECGQNEIPASAQPAREIQIAGFVGKYELIGHWTTLPEQSQLVLTSSTLRKIAHCA
jgi:hypothetical protein